MGARLAGNRYGKERIRLLRAFRDETPHRVADLTVGIELEGRFEAAYVEGENAAVLPTDTMKNAVYAVAADDRLDPIEAFAVRLARHFLATPAPLETVRVAVEERPWRPVEAAGEVRPDAFARSDAETRTCEAVLEAGPRGAERLLVSGGIEGLVMLKTARSAFSGFLVDELTTLEETEDRILATRVSVRWTFAATDRDVDHTACRYAVREALLATFADHDSRSVQHTLHAMGEAALAACEEIERITLSLPNLHHLPVAIGGDDLSARAGVYRPVDEPYGLIEATVERG